MSYFRLVIFFLLIWLVSPTKSVAQYLPDTSLTYPLFIQQATSFAQSGNNQEAWVVNFWASWNSPSLYAIPRLKELHREFEDKPFRFVSISVDKSYSAWVQRIKYFKMPWEQLFLPDEADYEYLRQAFIHRSLPATFIVYPNGTIKRVRDTQELRTVMAEIGRELPRRGVSNDVADTSDPFDEPAGPTRDNFEPADPEPSNAESGQRTYTVRPNDTLYSLHKRFGVPVESIRRANSLSGNTIKVGQQLIIPNQ